MPHRQRAVRLNVPNPLALALALAFAGTAHAEDRPYYIGVSQGFTHDSNMFRSPSPQKSDTISSTGVLGGIDYTLSRQHVYANLSAQANRHSNFEQLNNTSYSATTGLNWQAADSLSGTLRYSANQNLVNYADVSTPIGTRDVQKTQQAVATARLAIASQYAVEGTVDRRTVDFSAVQDVRGFDQKGGSIGLRWGGTGILSVGLAARGSKTNTPQAVITPFIPGDPLALPPIPDVVPTYGPDKADRRDIDLTAVWTPSSISSLNARLSWSRETHTQPTIPTFSGLTGSLAWDYKPTGRTSFKLNLVRDTSSETVFSGLPLGLVPVRADNDRLNTLIELQANWEATAKINVIASLKHGSGTTVSTATSAGFNSTTDVIGIGARYQATRGLTFACDLNQENRNHVYDATVGTCSAQFVLR